ncbi:hypothetical protein BCON_0023g00320 [Botryotinia convoluta]|uniref:Uncharacterized protein n=1 Tax=Botryotinia convoluta TaxID=54673 RepID=A0A4Z1IRV0_9HELO|nr:hypothetical protein BCON_0023g00320 [Botryotinia convoluta]
MNTTDGLFGQSTDYSVGLIMFANRIDRSTWAALLCAGLVLITTISVMADQRKAIAPHSGRLSQKDIRTIFTVRRNDTDLLIISNAYLDELRLLPNTKLSSVQTQVKASFSVLGICN